jgi:RimJ/RimL family protein N-acetyltransferase
VSSARASVPNIAFLPIALGTLQSGTLAYSDNVLREIRSMWPSEERFRDRGFGIVAVLDGEIICWCTAEYVSPERCGTGIETSPRFEGRGVATATASRFVHLARERAITPCWECDSSNYGSIRVAEKVGFVRQAEETYWIGAFDQS